MFAACEKVLVDQQNNVSLIALLQQLNLEIPPPGDSEPRPVAAIRWNSFAMWLKPDEDENATYEQRVELVDPSGNATGIEATTPFRFGDKLTMRSIATILGFPIHATGRYMLKLWVQEKGQDAGSDPAAEFPILVTAEQPKATQAAITS